MGSRVEKDNAIRKAVEKENPERGEGVGIVRKDEEIIYQEPETVEEGAMSECASSVEYFPFIMDPGGFGTRYSILIMGFFGLTISYMMRVNLSMAIVSMSRMKNMGQNSANVCVELMSPSVNGSDGGDSDHSDDEGEFHWTPEEEGIILGAFFWGYGVTQIPGGILAQRRGAKWTLGIGILITAIFALITPSAARGGLGPLIVVRIFQGLGQGVTFPAIHVLLSKWIPPMERSISLAIVYNGINVGTLIALALSGALIGNDVMGGWPSVFYIFGILGIVWFVIWVFVGFDSPAKHPRIKQAERDYIQSSLGSQKSKRLKTPWKKILTCRAVYAIIVTQIAYDWGLYTMLTELPSFMKNVLHYNIKENSLLSAMMYLIQAVAFLVISSISDLCMKKRVLPVTYLRKLFNSFGHYGAATALFVVAYSGCNRALTVSMLAVGLAMIGCSWCAGFAVNMLDMAPAHVGVIMGLSNALCNFCGIISPFVTGYIVNDDESTNSWRKVFLISACLYLIVNTIYIFNASCELQPWNDEIEILDPMEEESENDASPPKARKRKDAAGAGAEGDDKRQKPV